jgi:hypothetical protein
MICEKCKESDHILCPQGTWCDCQHKVRRIKVQVTARHLAAASQVFIDSVRRYQRRYPGYR